MTDPTAPAAAGTKLDEQGAQEYRQERERHAAALAALRPGDCDAIAEEFNRHFDRVNQILRDFAGRSGRGAAAGLHVPRIGTCHRPLLLSPAAV